jgi:hypothetical protein
VPLSNFVQRGFGFVYHSIAILDHQVPNLSITIRNFFIAGTRGGGRRPPLLAAAAHHTAGETQHARRRRGQSERGPTRRGVGAPHISTVFPAPGHLADVKAADWALADGAARHVAGGPCRLCAPSSSPGLGVGGDRIHVMGRWLAAERRSEAGGRFHDSSDSPLPAAMGRISQNSGQRRVFRRTRLGMERPPSSRLAVNLQGALS